ncbi:MAG: helix-turn-helix transcriptional regulator [Notoacmeibacter sp.]|nr:helix-turn-helix transcriptional regulator [Notoacmeibacter sp.]
MVPEPERRQVAITLLGLEEEDPAVAGAGYGGWTTVASDAAVRRLIGTVDMARKSAPRLDPAAFWPVGALAFVLSVAALAYLRRRSGLPRPAILDGVPPAMPEPVHLTSREREILALVGTGKTTKEIARDLGISPKTVEFHRSHLMRKFDAHNMAELVLKAGGTLAA